MSFNSCYSYILGLPLATLQEMVRGALGEDETAGVQLTFTREGVPVSGGLTADITASVTDAETATLGVPGTDLDLTLSLSMRLEVDVVELPDLDPIIYHVSFTLPGEFARDESEAVPKLQIHFPSVTSADLGLSILGGELVLGPALLQTLVDEAVAAHPELLGPTDEVVVVVTVTVEIFHDDPMAPGFRGRITATMPDATTLRLLMPGHIEFVPPLQTSTDMQITVDVPVERNDVAGQLVVHFEQVTSSNVSIQYVTPPLANVTTVLKGKVATSVAALGPAIQTIPSSAELESLIGSEIATFAETLEIGYDMPPPADPAAIDLSTFVPATLPGALLLQLEPFGDGTVCDAVDSFVDLAGFSLVVSEPALQPFLQQVRSSFEGQQRVIQGHNVTVTHITTALHDSDGHDAARGHLWIEGNADVEIDCWPDAGVDFWGPVFLVPRHEPDGLHFDANTGTFGAEDDTSCEDVNPDDIAALVESEPFGPFEGLPDSFGGIGSVDLQVTSVDIFAAGFILKGTFTLTTLSALLAGEMQRRSFWGHESAAGSP